MSDQLRPEVLDALNTAMQATGKICAKCIYFNEDNRIPDSPYKKEYGRCSAPIPVCAESQQRSYVRRSWNMCKAWSPLEAPNKP